LAKRRSKFTPRVKEPEYNINRRIRVTEVRIVGSNLKEISDKYGQTIESGIYPTKQALAIAEAVEMDLVEISAKAKPPVARIVDYSKFLYEKKKREKEIKSNAQKTVIKEIRFGPNTDDHDFQFKLRHAEKFLEEGAKVKAFVQFRGRSIVFKERGELLLLRFIEALTKIGQPEALPKMEGRRMFVFVAPKKIPKKVVKSSKKDGDKSKKVAKNTPEEVKTETPVKIEAVTPNEVKTETPVKVEAVTPEEVQAETPVKVEVVTPEEVQTETPEKVEAVTPEEVQTETPAKVEAATPEEVKVETPVKEKAVATKKVKTKTPAKVEAVAPKKVEVEVEAPVKEVTSDEEE
jgi:translation initiation factor IF-3